jgi:hypothetical protein
VEPLKIGDQVVIKYREQAYVAISKITGSDDSLFITSCGRKFYKVNNRSTSNMHLCIIKLTPELKELYEVHILLNEIKSNMELFLRMTKNSATRMEGRLTELRMINYLLRIIRGHLLD